MPHQRLVRTVTAVSATALAVLISGCVTITPLGSGGPQGSADEKSIAGATTVPEPGQSGPRKTRKPRPARTSAPTSAPTATAPPTATDPAATPSEAPTAPPTDTAPPAATPEPTINYSLPAVYGSTSLSAGFVPDPFTVGITAGGPANSNYLGGGCYGYTTSAPSFSVNYTSGSSTLLRFYFISSGDTTMIINSPGGSYFCVDDSFGTVNPTIDFNSPSSGRYDIWIATYNAADSLAGTLYLTELSTNHP